MYTDYLKRLQQDFEAEIDRIETEYGFEYGSEFEEALKQALRAALPGRYGVDNGHIVDPSGKAAGDDLIIYEKLRYPTLRNSAEGQRKNRIPREAVYCYLEAKHSVCLEGDGGQSLSKALDQVADAKDLVKDRKERSITEIGKHNFSNTFSIDTDQGYPSYQNPPYGAIFARQVRPRAGDPPLSNPVEVNERIAELQDTNSLPFPQNQDLWPDLLVLGPSLVAIPGCPKPDQGHAFRPFYIPKETTLVSNIADHGSFGIGFAAMMAALDWIHLGEMPWDDMIINGLSPTETTES